MQWNESGTKVASSSERSSARGSCRRWAGGQNPGRPERVRLRGRWSAVGPPELGSGWARRAGRRVGLTVARFRVSADSAVESILKLGCPSRAERLSLGGVEPWPA